MTKNDEERRAYELLQWVPYGLPAEFDDGLAQAGYYSKIQRQRSDEALDAFDAAHPYETSPELAAFRELERLRIHPAHTLSSPRQKRRMITTPDDSKSYASPEALNDHKALLRDVQQAAVAVILTSLISPCRASGCGSWLRSWAVPSVSALLPHIWPAHAARSAA